LGGISNAAAANYYGYAPAYYKMKIL